MSCIDMNGKGQCHIGFNARDLGRVFVEFPAVRLGGRPLLFVPLFLCVIHSLSAFFFSPPCVFETILLFMYWACSEFLRGSIIDMASFVKNQAGWLSYRQLCCAGDRHQHGCPTGGVQFSTIPPAWGRSPEEIGLALKTGKHPCLS